MAPARKATTQTPDPPLGASAEPPGDGQDPAAETDHDGREDIQEIPAELSCAAPAVREDLEESWVALKAVSAYLWLMNHAPKSTRGKLLLAAAVFFTVMAPSGALLYVTFTAGEDATAAWFDDLGYAGVFLANLASTATLFIPVPGLTAAAQALIVSSAQILNPFWVGVVGGLGMAIGEVTAYVAGMATALIVREEEITAPRRLQPLIDRVTRSVNWLMARYGMPTLFVLSAIPNPIFEVAGWTAGATRFSFLKFLASVTPGKITRGIFLAYLGEKVIFG